MIDGGMTVKELRALQKDLKKAIRTVNQLRESRNISGYVRLTLGRVEETIQSVSDDIADVVNACQEARRRKRKGE